MYNRKHSIINITFVVLILGILFCWYVSQNTNNSFKLISQADSKLSIVSDMNIYISEESEDILQVLGKSYRFYESQGFIYLAKNEIIIGNGYKKYFFDNHNNLIGVIGNRSELLLYENLTINKKFLVAHLLKNETYDLLNSVNYENLEVNYFWEQRSKKEPNKVLFCYLLFQ